MVITSLTCVDLTHPALRAPLRGGEVAQSVPRDMRLNKVPDVNPCRVHSRSNAPIGTMEIGTLFAYKFLIERYPELRLS